MRDREHCAKALALFPENGAYRRDSQREAGSDGE
jgi:hypothetical protein